MVLFEYNDGYRRNVSRGDATILKLLEKGHVVDEEKQTPTSLESEEKLRTPKRSKNSSHYKRRDMKAD